MNTQHRNFVTMLSFLIFFLVPTLILATEPIRCLKCGMHINKHPQWEATIIHAEQEDHFCAPRCILLTRPADSNDTEGEMLVKDYYDLRFIDATTAFYVHGSKVMGPMGPDLIPFSSIKDAEAFIKEHGGAISPYQQLTSKTLQQLLPMKQHKKNHTHNN